MDNDEDGLVSARGLSVALGLSARAEAAARLRALYCAHAPPLLAPHDLRPAHYTDTGEELATDAISYFHRYICVPTLHTLIHDIYICKSTRRRLRTQAT